jgi:hypothetical protein
MLGTLAERYMLPLNSSSFETNLSHLAGGVYFYSLVIDGQKIRTEKIIIAK